MKKPLRYALTIRILLVLSVLASALLPTGCGEEAHSTIPTDTEDLPSSAVLLPCEDRGQAYLDGFIFFGESTTYHMKSRGVLSGGTATGQVWGPDSGTVNLDATTVSILIRYPETGEYIPFSEAIRRAKPPRILLTFGLNGAVRNVRLGAEYYKSCYGALIDVIREASPETEILLQSCFPIAASMDVSRYTVSAKELNSYISRINGWVLELAEARGLGYLNTAEALRDEHGFLREEYQAGDGYHLNEDAYRIILEYIRTHG